MTRLCRTLIAAGLLLAGLTAGAQPETEPPDIGLYAWGFPIVAEGDASFYRVSLPLLVNQSVSDAQLRDAGVYNSAGQPVPRIFEQPVDQRRGVDQVVVLPAIPLYEGVDASAESVRLRFERKGDNTVVQFDSDGKPATDSGQRLTAYIIDARGLKEAINGLELGWDTAINGFIGRVTVEGSSNLENWRELGAGTLADLREGQTNILQTRVKLRATQTDYLRLRWQDLPDNWQLATIRASYRTGPTPPSRNLTLLESSSEKSDDGGVIFDLGGAPLVDQVRLVLGQPNTVLFATLFYQSGDGKWVQIASGSQYHIGRGSNVALSPAMSMRAARTGRFKVLVKRGHVATPMQLEVGWYPDTLLFLAQGEPPFTLATGRADDAREQFPQQRLYGHSSLTGLAGKNRAATASLGPRYALGGDTRLTPQAVTNWPRLLLWLGLGLGVALVVVMAFKVIGDLKRES